MSAIKSRSARTTLNKKKGSLSVVVRFLGVAVGLIAIVASAGILLLLKHDPLPIVEAKAVASARGKIEDANVAAQSGQHKIVHLNEDEVNSMLHERLLQGKVPPNKAALRDVRVRLIGDQVRAYIVLAFQASSITVELQGKLDSRDGFVNFDPTSGTIGSFPIPQSALSRAMLQIMDSPEKRQRFRLQGALSALRIENSEVVLTYN